MAIFASIWIPVGPEFDVPEVKNRSVGPSDSSPVQMGVDLMFDLEGRCSIQLSYGRTKLI